MLGRVALVFLAVAAVGLTALNLATAPSGPSEVPAQIREGARVGEVRVTEPATVCLKPETISKSFLALDAGDYEASNRMIAGSDCAKVPAGQPVTLTGRWTELPVGQAPTDMFRFVEYVLPSGDVVWGFEQSIG